MSCRLPHTAKQLQWYVKEEAKNSDVDRQKAIVDVILKFERAKRLKRELRESYVECTDISDDRKYVIDTFLYDEYRRDAAVIESLWACVKQVEDQITNKIRWSREENVESDRVEQQQQRQHQLEQQQQAFPSLPQQLSPPLSQLQSQISPGASSSHASRVVVQQQLPHLDNFQPSFENAAVDDSGWTSDMERELSRLEAEWEEEKLASFKPYDDGYDSNNSQTWDHPDYL